MVKTEEETDDFSGLIIIPKKSSDNTQLPPIYFKRIPKYVELRDVDDIAWNKEVRINSSGTEEEYGHRVDWWFEHAISDVNFKKMINENFDKNGFNVKMSWEKAKTYLKTVPNEKRKTYLYKFINNWLLKGYQWQLDRQSKGK